MVQTAAQVKFDVACILLQAGMGVLYGVMVRWVNGYILPGNMEASHITIAPCLENIQQMFRICTIIETDLYIPSTGDPG